MGGHHSAKIILWSVEFCALKENGGWETQRKLLCHVANQLERADFIVSGHQHDAQNGGRLHRKQFHSISAHRGLDWDEFESASIELVSISSNRRAFRRQDLSHDHGNLAVEFFRQISSLS